MPRILVRSNTNSNYFDYFYLEDNGSVTFGSEEGNYAGGDTLSEKYHDGNEGKYWHDVLDNLIGLRKYNRSYFDSIMDELQNSREQFKRWEPEGLSSYPVGSKWNLRLDGIEIPVVITSKNPVNLTMEVRSVSNDSGYKFYRVDREMEWFIGRLVPIGGKEKMKKVFISQPMKGLGDADILKERERAIKKCREQLGEEIEVVDSFFEGAPADAKPAWFLGKSIELLSTADVAFFVSGWQGARGCRIEHTVAMEYGIEVIAE